MKRLVMLAVLALVAIAFSGVAYAQEGKYYSLKEGATIEPWLEGQQSMQVRGCLTCHSFGPSGNKKGPLDGIGKRLSADQIRTALTDPADWRAKSGAKREPACPPKPQLKKFEVDAFVVFLQSLTQEKYNGRWAQ